MMDQVTSYDFSSSWFGLVVKYSDDKFWPITGRKIKNMSMRATHPCYSLQKLV